MTSSVDVLRAFVSLDRFYDNEWLKFVFTLNNHIGNYIGFDSIRRGASIDVVINIMLSDDGYCEHEGQWQKYVTFNSYHAPDFQDIPDEIARESIPITEELIEELKYIREMSRL